LPGRNTRPILKKMNRISCIDADARRVGELVGGKFDIVVARKPNVAELTSVWREIFENVRDKMKEDSILIATSFTAKEHALMEEILKTAGFRIFLNEANPFARPLEIKNGIQISVDHSIIIAKLGRA